MSKEDEMILPHGYYIFIIMISISISAILFYWIFTHLYILYIICGILHYYIW
jgi:hypothetical protein